MGKKIHYTPQEIIAQCNAIAREKRMAVRSPWTAMAIVCGYSMLKSEGFKAKRIAAVLTKVNDYEDLWRNGELTVEQANEKLFKIAEWKIEYEEYKESDITAKKNSFQYYIDKIQIEPQNTINETSVRYLIFFFLALNEMHGYGKERLTRIKDLVNKTFTEYQDNRYALHKWKAELLDAGIYFENPIDPLTQEKGSLTCGGYE